VSFAVLPGATQRCREALKSSSFGRVHRRRSTASSLVQAAAAYACRVRASASSSRRRIDPSRPRTPRLSPLRPAALVLFVVLSELSRQKTLPQNDFRISRQENEDEEEDDVKDDDEDEEQSSKDGVIKAGDK